MQMSRQLLTALDHRNEYRERYAIVGPGVVNAKDASALHGRQG
jgi:hypothetical protein